jgi:hypothetical protein
MRRDDFNIEDLQIEHIAPIADQPVSKRRPGRKGEFVVVPLEWMHRLAGARYKATTTLALHLLHRAFKERHHTIKVANGLLALKGVSRRQKWRALLELESMGLIKVEHRGRRSPGITLLCLRDEA